MWWHWHTRTLTTMGRHACGYALANAGHDTTAIVTLAPKRVVRDYRQEEGGLSITY